MKPSTERFSDRVDNYVKYRPRYPSEVLTVLREEAALAPGQVIADVGSGTGILSELFLAEGFTVYGVEPNQKMREAAESIMSPRYPAFHSRSATAEDTGLASASIDLVAAGQAFHWFDAAKMKAESRRILRPGGRVALLWNDRLETDPLGREYEGLLEQFGIDYAEVAAKYRFGDEPIREFFGDAGYRLRPLPNEQLLDLEAFRGRLLSASYAPNPGHPNHAPMMRALSALFEKFREGDRVRMRYQTKVYVGRIS